MKAITLILFCCAVIFFGCNNQHDRFQSKKQLLIENDKLEDSLRWFFYAYVHKGKALFEKNKTIIEIDPTSCEINIDSKESKSDSISYQLSLIKGGYKYKYIYEGLMVYGFVYTKGVFFPLTDMIRLDSLENYSSIKSDNKKTDSIFKSFLKEVPSSKLSPWLLAEAKKRGVIPN